MGSFAVSGPTNTISRAVLPKLRPLEDYRLTKPSVVLFLHRHLVEFLASNFAFLKSLAEQLQRWGYSADNCPLVGFPVCPFLLLFGGLARPHRGKIEVFRENQFLSLPAVNREPLKSLYSQGHIFDKLTPPCDECAA